MKCMNHLIFYFLPPNTDILYIRDIFIKIYYIKNQDVIFENERTVNSSKWYQFMNMLFMKNKSFHQAAVGNSTE